MHVFRSVGELVGGLPDACLLVDMPMGLPMSSPRDVEAKARTRLKGKSASVFPVPCRRAVYASSYEAACEINQAAFGRKITLQAWHICPKIRELDEALVKEPVLAERIVESHPELVFACLAGKPLATRKRRPEGIAERLMLLERFLPEAGSIFESACSLFRRRDVARDDIVDALALLVCAQLGWTAMTDSRGTDERGIPIRLAVPHCN